MLRNKLASDSMGRFLSIAIGVTLRACVLGIGLDIVTANVAVDYFLVHHPKIFPTESPWVLALVWGVAASWWFGAISGVVVAAINQYRKYPLKPVRILKWTTIGCVVVWSIMIVILMAVMAISSTIPLERRPATFEYDRRLVAVAMAHQYEYVLGAIVAVVISIATWYSKTGESSVEQDESSVEETDTENDT